MSRFLVYVSIWLFGIVLYLFGWFALAQLPWYGWLVLVLLVLLIFEIKLLSRLPVVSVDFWSQLVSPAVFFVSSILFLLFLEGEFLQHVFIAIFSFALVLYLHNFWLFYRRPEKYHAFMLENFSWYLLSTSVFLLSATLYGLIIFVNFKWYAAILTLMGFTGLASYKLWWVEKLNWKYFWLPFLLMQVIVIEVFFSLLSLPLGYYILAFWFAGIWLISQKVVIDIGKSSFYYRRLVQFSAVFVLIALALTATARWF